MTNVNWTIVKEFVVALASNDLETLKLYPHATATATRALGHATLNSTLPFILFGFLNEKYPEAAKNLQSYLQGVQVYMAMINILAVSGLATALEFAGRKWTGNLLAGHNFRLNMMMGLPVLLVMQTFASSLEGKTADVGKFWNNLTDYNPLLPLFLTMFLMPAIFRSFFALGHQAVIDIPKAAVAAKGIFNKLCAKPSKEREALLSQQALDGSTGVVTVSSASVNQ